MNKIKIIQKGNKILSQVANEVAPTDIKSAEIQDIIKKLKQAIAESEEAVAVAAPQIGKSLRIFAVSEYIFSPENKEKKKNDYGYLVFINPKILKKSRGQKIMTEGCLSAKNIYGTIKRSEKIKVEAYDENGKKFIKSGSGLFAQVIQHEMDHLEGVLFTDKAVSLKKLEKLEK
ncbi:MAG: peptide deformylase [Candidatus Tagabacteria bacterium]